MWLKNAASDIYVDDFMGIIGPNGGQDNFLKLLIGQVKPLREVSTYSGKQLPIGYCTGGMLDKNFSHNVIRKFFPTSIQKGYRSFQQGSAPAANDYLENRNEALKHDHRGLSVDSSRTLLCVHNFRAKILTDSQHILDTILRGNSTKY